MKKVIIGIHGLGNKPPKYLLKKWWEDAMLEGFAMQKIRKTLPEFEMVYWADILHDKPLDNWEKNKESPYYMNEPYVKSPGNFVPENHTIRQKVMDFITSQLNRIFLNEDKSLNYQFLTDMIVKKYFSDLEAYYNEVCTDEKGESVKAGDLIRNRVVEVIRKYQGYEILLIAHSMGSIIVFDVLNFLMPGIPIKTLVTIGSPLGFPVVISKIAAEQKERTNGKSLMATPPGITSAWYNMADILDHVALNYKLGDDFTGNKAGVHPIDFLVNNNYENKGVKNPHKSYGYLRTPEFSKILSEFTGEERVNIPRKVFGKIRRIIKNVRVQGEKVKDRLNLD